MYIYLYLNSRTRLEAFDLQCWSKIVKIRPKLLEIRSLLVGRPQTLELGSNERSLRSNFVQNCSKFQQNVVQLAQNVAKFDVLGPIFVLFRGCSACATRLAAQRAEPLFLLAGAVLSRVRRLCRQIENPPKLTKNWSSDASWTDCAQKVVFFRFRAWLSNDFWRLGTLPNLSRRSFWCTEPPSGTLRTLLERAGDVPRRSRDACRMLVDVLGRPESLPGLICSRFWVSQNRFWIHFRVLHCTILDKVARCCPMLHAIGYSCVILRKHAHTCISLHDLAQLPQYHVAQHYIAQYCILHIARNFARRCRIV